MAASPVTLGTWRCIRYTYMERTRMQLYGEGVQDVSSSNWHLWTSLIPAIMHALNEIRSRALKLYTPFLPISIPTAFSKEKRVVCAITRIVGRSVSFFFYYSSTCTVEYLYSNNRS